VCGLAEKRVTGFFLPGKEMGGGYRLFFSSPSFTIDNVRNTKLVNQVLLFFLSV
jgi:hypothetical protein